MYEYKKMLKKISIFLLILAPLVIIFTYILSLFDVPTWLNIVANVIFGGAFCLLFQFIYNKIIENKKKKELLHGKPKDPFTD